MEAANARINGGQKKMARLAPPLAAPRKRRYRQTPPCEESYLE
jgi:hypothetical protein